MEYFLGSDPKKTDYYKKSVRSYLKRFSWHIANDFNCVDYYYTHHRNPV